MGSKRKATVAQEVGKRPRLEENGASSLADVSPLSPPSPAVTVTEEDGDPFSVESEDGARSLSNKVSLPLETSNISPIKWKGKGVASVDEEEVEQVTAEEDGGDITDGDKEELARIRDDVRRRLVAMRREADKEKGTFYITNVPTDLQFGRMESFFDMRNFLVNNKNSAIRVFVAGFVISYDFRTSEGHPQRRVSITIRPLSVQDSWAASNICNTYGDPTVRTTKDSFLHIQAARWQTTYRAPRESPGTLFTNVYLAEKSIRERTPSSIDSLSRGDLVVLELRIHSRGGEGRGRIIDFQLQSVNIMQRDVISIESPREDVVDDVSW